VTGDLDDRLDELVRACEAIEGYVDGAERSGTERSGTEPSGTEPSGMVLDAVRMRLVEIGAVVATLPPEVTAAEPGIPWARLAGVGDRLTGRRRVSASVLLGTARVDVPRLRAAAERLREIGAPTGGLGVPPDPAG